MPSFRSPADLPGRNARAAARLASATVLAMALGLLISPGVSAQDLQEPAPYSQPTQAHESDMLVSPGATGLETADPSPSEFAAGDPSGNRSQIDGESAPKPSRSTKSAEHSSPAFTEEPTAQASPKASKSTKPAEEPQSVEVPVDELSEEQLLELLKDRKSVV